MDTINELDKRNTLVSKKINTLDDEIFKKLGELFQLCVLQLLIYLHLQQFSLGKLNARNDNCSQYESTTFISTSHIFVIEGFQKEFSSKVNSIIHSIPSLHQTKEERLIEAIGNFQLKHTLPKGSKKITPGQLKKKNTKQLSEVIKSCWLDYGFD